MTSIKSWASWLEALLLATVALSANPHPASSGPDYEVSVTKTIMGTVVEATLIAPDVEQAKQDLRRAFLEMERIDDRLGASSSTSEIVRINSGAGLSAAKVSWETLSLLERAKRHGRESEGDFDISIGPLLEAWGFGIVSSLESAPPDLSTLVSLVGFDQILLSPPDTLVSLATKGMKLDLGAIGKGYAVDRAAETLRQLGYQDFLLSAGGDVLASGRRTPEARWRVGIRDPRDANSLIATLSIENQAIATSGDYERFVIIGGTRFHHVLDPMTGMPATCCQSVSVLAASAEEADVLATTLFVRGLRRNSRAKAKIANYVIVDSLGRTEFDANLVQANELEILSRTEMIPRSEISR